MGSSYSGSVAVTVGLGVTYSISSGSLPAGLSLNTSTGQLTGTPTTTGSSTFTVSATNAYGGPVTQQVTLTTLALPSFGSFSPTVGQINTPYSYSPSVSGSGPITYSVSSGTLPAGLTLNPATGAISGTPTSAGSFPVTITATNAAGSVNQSGTITIAQAPSFTGFTSPPNAIVGSNYSGSVAATAGTGLTYSITAGSLPPGLTLNPSTGALTGTATTTGSYTFTVAASNSLGTATQSVTILAQALPAFTTSPTSGLVGTAYSFTPTVTGTGPITYAVTSGLLPPGLTINQSTGAITGTPTTAGSYPFTVTATGAAGATAQPMTVQINQAPSYAGVTQPPSAVVGSSYSGSVAATAGTGVTYAVTSGTLPAGLTLNPNTGAITGTSTTTGSSTFTVTATNSYGSAAQQFSINSQAAPSFTAAAPTSGLVGSAYSYPFVASGTGPISYSVSSGTLPAGLTLNPSTGVLSGTPTTAGTSTFTVTATGPAGSAAAPVSVTVNQAPTYSGGALGTGLLGQSYAGSVAATGTGPITYSVSSGTLPAGLTLNPSTGAITGTPTATGTSTFTITATNAYGTGVQPYSLTVSAATAPVFTSAAPTSGTVGTPFTSPTPVVGSGAFTFAIASGSLPPGLTLNPSTGVVSGTPTVAGMYSYALSATNSAGVATQQVALVVVSSAGPSVSTAAALTIDIAVGATAQGAPVTATGHGLMPGAAWVITLHSTPMIVATGTVPSTGTVSQQVTLPTGIPAGSHTLILDSMSVTGQPVAAQAWLAITATGTMTALSYSGPVSAIAATLAGTGADIQQPVVFGSVLAALGLLMLVGAGYRRRREDEQLRTSRWSA